ncbi:MAG TPA: EAL domain-containing protein [Solirubrobacteraceae bacterium]|nr:EAL domain-containing protein [Solirubrobacteraceae bacterium]
MLLPDEPLGGERSDGPAPADGDAGADGDPLRRRRWLVAVCAVLVVGVASSIAASLTWRASVREHERESFATAATYVSGQLDTLLRRDTDYVRAVRAAMTMQPRMSASTFEAWSSYLEDHDSALGSYGALVVKSVPASELAAFQARRDAEPAFRRMVGGRVEPVAVTGRSSYCLLAGGSVDIGYSAEAAAVLQGDWCDPDSLIGGFRQDGTTRARFTRTVTESGQFLAYAARTGGVRTLIVEGAYYRRGAPIATPPERRAAVLGWVLGSFAIQTLLKAALHGDRGLHLALYHTDGGVSHAELIGAAGSAAGGAHPLMRSSSLPLDGTWIVKVAGAPQLSGPSADVQALAVLIGGLIATALLFALVLVLARSRERALAMVQEKTGQLRHQALHDALTGLPNRVLALDRAEQMLARARRGQHPVAALYVDLDGFKEVNDTFGHAAGDALLRIVAERLRGMVREGDTAARLGGDEFVVLVEGSTLDAGPELVAERVLRELSRPYDMTSEIGRELSLTASVGIACGLRASADELLRDADIALYAAKSAGRDRHALFHPQMQAVAHARLTTQLDLVEAIDRDQLLLLYRPVFDLRARCVAGVQALVRWRHPTRGVLAHEEFAREAEVNGMSVPIGSWALREACAQAVAWRAHGTAFDVSLALSERQLLAPALLEDVRAALSDSGLEPAALMLEVAESSLTHDASAASERLRALEALGVRVAIDGFDVGLAALSRLPELGAHALKLDRALIERMLRSPHAKALIDAFVQLGATLDVRTLGEGIERRAPLSAALDAYCDRERGFALARALTLAEVHELARAVDAASRETEPAR